MHSFLAGATGFVGRNLAQDLAEDGIPVRALVRDRDLDAGLAALGVDLVEADLGETPDLAHEMAGCEVAYFLVHMMGRRDDWAQAESQAAAHFAAEAKAAGVGRIVYLGGLGDPRASEHLRSRHRTAETLREHGPPLTYVRAAMIVGAGSESFELLRSIVERLPMIPDTEWLHSRTQPIGIRDAVAYLRDCGELAETAGREIQIGGPDVCTHLEIVDAMAREMGRQPPRRANIPGATPEAVAAAASAVTTGDPDVAEAIAAGLPGDTVVTDPSGMEIFEIDPERLSIAIQRALEAEERAAA